MENPYKSIKNKKDYEALHASGMFWEFHPELTGNWNIDKLRILGDEAEERINIIGQNGNDGLHYKDEPKPGDQLKFNFEEDE